MIYAHQVEDTLNAIGYSHGRHEDQFQRVRDFRKVQGGNNFMTPRILGMYRLKAKPYVIVEVSTGEFMGDDLIGCTAVDCATGEKLHDAAECLHSLDDLPAYFAKLERQFS